MLIMKLIKRKKPETFERREIILKEAEPEDLEEIVDQVMAEYTKEILEIQVGIRSSLYKIVTETMRRSGGKADPKKIRHLIISKL